MNTTRSIPPPLGRRLGPLLALTLLVALAAAQVGCELLMLGARAFEAEGRVEKEYDGLAKQSIAIMVWTDRATRIDFPTLQADLARTTQSYLVDAQLRRKKKHLEGARFIDYRSVLRYQRDHPEIDGVSITEVAPRLQASRVIYIEIERFELRSPLSIELLKGTCKATLRIVEVADGAARIALEDADVLAEFPEKSKEGIPPSDRVNDIRIYQGLITQTAKELSKRLKIYPEGT